MKRGSAPSVSHSSIQHIAPDEVTDVARLTRERDEALEQQAATAEVLKVISRSTFDLPAVLNTLIESACRLCGADIGTIRFEEGDRYCLAATYGCPPEWHSHFAGYSGKPDKASVFGQTILKGATVHIPDVLEDSDYARPQAQKLMGLRAALGVPLVRDGHVFGVVNLFRTTPTAFTQEQIELAETFADQAVIAIENTRLLNELRQRTDDLSESLEQQTATSEVLKVISSSASDLQPVFDTMAENAVRLCEAERAYVFRFDGELLRAVATYNVGPENREFVNRNPIAPGRRSVSARAALERRSVQVPDVQADPEFAYAIRDVDPIRTVLAVPMLKGNDLVGTITIYRLEVKPFTDKQVTLVETFAAQAVIAIENTRLLSELRESLQQQTAT
ncbi:MAG: GAF domain-containing protein, partial [Pseudolabrys sp.]